MKSILLMKMKVIIITVLGLGVTVGLVAQQQSKSERLATTGVNSAITTKLQEIVVIREKLFKNYELLRAAGRGAVNGTAEIDLAEARIELARERGQPETLLAELKDLVAAHERRLKRVQSVADREVAEDVDRAKAALLEAEVRLLRAQR